MTRRELIGLLLKTGVSLPLLNYSNTFDLFAVDEPFNKNLPPVKDRIIVMLRMFGGNDGLNTVVPYHDGLYYKYRKYEATVNCSIDEKVLIKPKKIDSFGFHPNCNDLNDLLTENKLAVIQNVGYPEQDLSHFRSTDIWLSGSDVSVYELSGWLGRYLEKKFPDFLFNVPEYPPAIEFGTSVSRILLGKYIPMGFAYTGESYIPDDRINSGNSYSKSKTEQNYISDIQHQSHVFLKRLNYIESNIIENAEKYPENNYVAKYLAHTARLIKSGLESNIYVINTLNMFDNHESLLEFQSNALKIISEAVGAFQRDLDKLGIADRVVTVLYSEFGRRVAPNGSGTDHGAAGPLFIIGNNVKGGVYGNNPNLADLDANGNLKFAVDFRQIYISLLSDWFNESYDLIFPYIITHNLPKIDFLRSSIQTHNFNVYPNPCHDYLKINIEFSIIENVEIFDLNGRKVTEIIISGLNSPLVTINTGKLNQSTYLLKIISNGQQYFSKFIKG